MGGFSKTPSQIQSRFDASEGGQRSPEKNLSERKVEKSVVYLLLTLTINNILHPAKTIKLGDHRSSLVERKKKTKTFKQTVVEVKGHNQDAPNKQSFWPNNDKLRKSPDTTDALLFNNIFLFFFLSLTFKTAESLSFSRFMAAIYYDESGVKTFHSEQTFRLPVLVYKMKELDVDPVARFRFKGC